MFLLVKTTIPLFVILSASEGSPTLGRKTRGFTQHTGTLPISPLKMIKYAILTLP